MSRLVDYFVIVGFDHEKERGGLSSGVILQRFPETNWEDVPFHDGIEWFCQPQGWALSTERTEPNFYVSVLTDVDANKHYCACLCFNETVSITPTKPVDEEEEESRPVSNITHQSIMYAPKCLVIVSRQDYIDTFRNCLGIIYTVWSENVGVPLETLVGNLLGGVCVPGAGGPAVRFSLGAGDRQALQPPAAPPLPTTQTSVHMLFRLMGIHNAVTLWCAVMSEHKVLLVSLAAARLAAACRALAALMFPFRYAHVFIPILPTGLVEVLATPTPFLIGVHSCLKEEVNELLDVIVADLDVGSLRVPGALSVPQPHPSLLTALHHELATVLQPELRYADCAFPPPPPAPSAAAMLDKEIRAVFMRTLATLLQGYRHCLTIIRIHPSPTLTFHKSGFLGARGLDTCPFAERLLDSMFFNGFVAERGPPWRTADIWDDLVQNLPEQLRLETLNPDLALQHIQELAMQIHLNENPNPQVFCQRVPRPPMGAGSRLHAPPLPPLDAGRVAALIAQHQGNISPCPVRAPTPRVLPLGAAPTGATADHELLLTNSARRLEVLRSCIAAIFECRYLDARKSFPAVARALRAAAARRALVADLAARLPGNKMLLQHHQFDLITRLMNCALQSATALDEHSIAAAMLPLATAYCRKLCTGVIQYAYMCIQEHQVWTNQQFWEAAFYQDVQRDIKALYHTTPQHQIQSSSGEDSDYISLLKAQEPSALEIAAEQMRLWPNLDPEKQRELVASEESTLYSQAIHYANRMVYLLLPLEGAGRRAEARGDDADRASNSITNSVAESDSADAESGFEEADPGEAGNNVIKMVSRFVDKVCTEGGVSASHVRCLHQMVPGVVHMHTETVDAVAREARRLPLQAKARIIPPTLLPGETLSGPGLRALLVSDGRASGASLPAAGALFLTDYRIVFRGSPADPTACEQTVIRSFPICALTKEKIVRNQYVAHVEQSLQEGLQLRSATFQLIKVAFEEEVTSEQIEAWRKQLSRARHPPDVLLHFAFAGKACDRRAAHKAAHTTLKGFAKKTLLKTARKAGLKSKPSKRQKYVLPSADARSLTSPLNMMSSLSADTLSHELETASVEVETACMSDARTLERLKDRSYAKDWARLGLATAPYRLSHANALYTVCRSYPALVPVPESVSDESVRRVARCYRQCRLPAATYRHARTAALLARSGAAHHRGVMGMLKASSHQQPPAHHAAAQAPPNNTETTSTIEQERYMSALVSCGGGGGGGGGAAGSLADSSLSLDSLALYCDEPATHTPLLTKAAGTLGVLGRNSGGKGGQFGRWGSLKARQSQIDLPSHKYMADNGGDPAPVRRAALYVVTEKGCPGGGVGDVLEVEVGDTRAAKHAFKKLMRACVPSAPTTEPNAGFWRLIEESGWLQMLRQLFQVSGAVVDLLDLQGSSVLLALEDGWDVTAQISSLAQICLDPYYRTLEGFRVLVEKEWLAFGHKFQTRLNLGPTPQQLTPTFLMFLDTVHQLQKQFPLAFEFNDHYLRFLAYHSVSCRYRTFLFDSEVARAELGLADGRRHDTGRMGVETNVGSEDEGGGAGGGGGGAGSPRGGPGASVFECIERLHRTTPAFHNPHYSPELDAAVLRPVSALPALELWQYYVCEQLSAGCPYERELCEPQPRPNVPLYETGGRVSGAALGVLLERLRALELELGHLPHAWRTRWDTLELPHTTTLQRSSSVSSALVRSMARAAHKRSTLELVVRGRQAAAPRHRFQGAALPAPAHCDHCDALLWPPAKCGVRCVECGAVCHERCAAALLQPCRRQPHQTGSSVAAPVTAVCYEQFSSNVAENRTHEGHLYKRGALLKGWKQRWFVLDSIKHQLRYYDAMEDSHCKGFIDLAEVIAVTPAPPAPGPPKKCDDRSFFDLRTSRRTYNFCASDANAAQEWIEKLQACLQ